MRDKTRQVDQRPLASAAARRRRAADAVIAAYVRDISARRRAPCIAPAGAATR